MTDSDKKIDKQESKSKTDKKMTAAPKSSNAAIYTLIFLVVLGILAGYYTLWEQQQENTQQQQSLTQRIDQELSTLKDQQSSITSENVEQFENIHNYQENLRLNLTNLIKNKQHLRNDWLMAEAEYLIQLANHRILLEKDVATAIVALKAADDRLSAVADPALLSVRKILLDDIQTLNNIPTIDLAGLSVTLSALSKNIPNLPLRTPDPKTHKLNQEYKPKNATEVKSLQDLPSAIWRDIRSLIVIRNHEKPLEPLLSPDQHFFLIQNLSLLLEQSRLALLNGHNEIYQERLATTVKWITQYFDTEHNVTRNMLASIDELQKFDIDPTLPDISTTFSSIKKYRTLGHLPAPVATSKPTPTPTAKPEVEVKEKP